MGRFLGAGRRRITALSDLARPPRCPPSAARRRVGGGHRTRRPQGGPSMFFHDKRLQYHAKPERPDPLYAKKLQEVLGGQWGEMSVMMMYLFQGWNCRGPA